MSKAFEMSNIMVIKSLKKNAEKETIKYLFLSLILSFIIGLTVRNPDFIKTLFLTVPMFTFTIMATIANFSHVGILHNELFNSSDV